MTEQKKMLSEVPLPWHSQQWERLARQYAQNLLPHAFLVCGDSGLGKSLFVSGFARFMLCRNPLNCFACGICGNCRQAGEEFTHPDIFRLTPEEGKRVIGIDQVRSLTDFMAQTSHAGSAKIVIIDNAHDMNTSSANALLKTLEEPTQSSYLFLVTDYPGSLPATIRSRCQRLVFTPPERAIARQWLQSKSANANIVDTDRLLTAAECRPLHALDLAEEGMLEKRDQFFAKLHQLSTGAVAPQSLVALSAKIGESAVIGYLLFTSSILIKSLMSKQRPYEADAALDKLYGLFIEPQKLIRDRLVNLVEFYDEAIKARKQTLGGTNPNVQLIIESLIWRWCQLL